MGRYSIRGKEIPERLIIGGEPTLQTSRESARQPARNRGLGRLGRHHLPQPPPTGMRCNLTIPPPINRKSPIHLKSTGCRSGGFAASTGLLLQRVCCFNGFAASTGLL